MVENNAVSLDPNDAVAGGLIGDVKVALKLRFQMWDYAGKMPNKVPAIMGEMTDLESGEVYEQAWSMGSGKDHQPSADGTCLLPVSDPPKPLNKSTNGMMLINSLIDNGFPVDKLKTGDISTVDGTNAHMIRVPAPKRAGLSKKQREDGREFEDTVLVVGEILQLPGEKPASPKGGGKKAAAGGKKTTTKEKEEAPGTEGAEVASVAIELLMDLVEAEGSVTKKQIPIKLYDKIPPEANKKAVLDWLFQDANLSAGPWKYEDGVVSSLE